MIVVHKQDFAITSGIAGLCVTEIIHQLHKSCIGVQDDNFLKCCGRIRQQIFDNCTRNIAGCFSSGYNALWR